MNFVITTFLILMLFFIYYYINNKELSSPAVVFTTSFILLLIFDIVNYSELGLNTLNWKTGATLLLGIISFGIGTLPFVNKCNSIGKSLSKKTYHFINQKVTSSKLLFFLGFEVIVLLLIIKEYGLNAGNFSFILGNIRNSTVNNGDSVLPKYLAFSSMITLMGGIFFSVEIPRLLYSKKIPESISCILCFVVSMAITFSGGSRGSAIILIFSLLCNYVVEFYRKNNWSKEFKTSTILKIIVVMIALLFGFKELSLLMGQTQVADYSFSRYILIYVGAQLKNLDMAITSKNIIGVSDVFGQETFRSFVNFFSNLFGNGSYGSYDLILPFNYYNGISLGNVYTTFYPYLRDFGYGGVVICSMLMGFICEFLYYQTKKFSKRSDGVSIWDILWSWAFFCLAFSFFSNKFYENIFSLNIINYIIAAFIVLIYFYGLPIKDGILKRRFW